MTEQVRMALLSSLDVPPPELEVCLPMKIHESIQVFLLQEQVLLLLVYCGESKSTPAKSPVVITWLCILVR